MADAPAPGQPVTADEIVRELRSIGLLSGGDAVERALQSGAQPREITAPVVLPKPEAMSVYLVSSHSIQMLDELRSDLQLYSGAVSLLLGGLLGVVTALLMSEFPQGDQLRNVIILSTILASILVFCLIRLRTVAKRVHVVRARMYSDLPSLEPEPPRQEITGAG